MESRSENHTTATGAPTLEVVGVSKRFGDAQVLSDVSLTLEPGSTLALVGENGAGKSTLIKMLAGVQPPDSGEIRLDGQRVDLDSPNAAQAAGIITVYQEFNLFDSLSVAENLLLGSYPRRARAIDWRALHAEARSFLAARGLEIDVTRKVATLSVAEKQMLEIAKALHRQVRILILDEPTAVLGGDDVTHLLEMVRSLRRYGISVIFVSHRLDEVLDLTDTYVVLKDGELVDRGLTKDTTHDGLVSKMVGRDLRLDELRQSATAGEERRTGREILRVEGLRRDGVLHDIDLTLHAGEVVGIAGLRGAGRTELARAIFGADPIDGGRILVDGRAVKIGSPRAAIKHGIGLVPEERKSQGLFMNLSSAQNIPVVRMAPGLFGWIRPDAERRLARDYAGRLDVRVHDVSRSVGGLSGGNQQKIVLAKWLEAGVSILILDEPTRGVDVGAKDEIYHVVRDLCAKGLGVLLISSDLPEVLAMSDRILVMHKGAISAEIDGATATEEEIMNAAVGGVHA
jgi:ABC-type sugar transport system ATPase subunit